MQFMVHPPCPRYFDLDGLYNQERFDFLQAISVLEIVNVVEFIRSKSSAKFKVATNCSYDAYLDLYFGVVVGGLQ